MSNKLPTAVARYLDICNGKHASGLDQCFTESATVRDEGQTHRGPEAIDAWLREAQRKFAYTVEPIDVTQRDSTLMVLARVSGDFPGSPVELTHVFRMRGDRIDALEIGG
ncbi:nuclear transport factor 2 family protein [Sinimarinibacterium sp. CAU 1509]|uniref:nuclear transport factor 2 family protein n=1 Tax=Sinimarinibacterium sp. CAU 1509 TaxID=2562283 RepID=UPI0010AC274F|nr:nuclear transport factor 2 family protein [Sinimarinibacterium sp. CAU 1509]TJY59984.1 nuclear transport factor 2 family protein [Sinimarinibacterium sp. CAU 1509]